MSKQDKPADEVAAAEKQAPTSAPEINPTLLTALQKRRIEEEFDVGSDAEDDAASNPQNLHAAKGPEPTVAPIPARPELRTEVVPEMPGKELVDESVKAEPEKTEVDDKAKPKEDDEEKTQEKPVAKKPSHSRNPFKAFWRHKKWTIPLLLLAILGGLGGVPYTRYALAAFIVTQPYAVTVTDASTKKPVSSAMVTLDGQQVMTDKDGKVTVKDVKPGKRELKITKKYYRDGSSQVLVPIYGGKGAQSVELSATGRQVPVTIVNKVSGKPLENATLKSVGTEVKTDKEGKASIVLPADKPDLEVTLNANGFNQLVGRITVTDQEVEENNFALVPAGRVYFLSKQSGKIDVVKTNLDGSDRQTVVFGTGKEDEANTVLLASRDWKYLALQSKRDSSPAKLYLVDTATDKMTPIDESNSSFNLVGWSDHNFVYSSYRNGAKEWDAGYQSIKSYSAEKKQALTIEQNQSEGDASSRRYQLFSQQFLVGDKLVYGAQWYAVNTSYPYTSDLAGKLNVIRAATVGTQTKKDLKSLPANQFGPLEGRVYEPGGVYFSTYLNTDSKFVYYEYEDGQIKDVNIDQNAFNSQVYPTYLSSPDGAKTFWNEQRDGRETFFVGDKDAKDANDVGIIDEGVVFGWYGNDYLLASKKGSELYIMPATGGTPLKVADYHKPQLTYRGYGGGYGGL